jgi:site-specific DNA recombinase
MKTKMDELEARKVTLTAAFAESPGPPALRQPPALSALYRAKIANLASALSDPSVQREATEAFRGLVFEIRMIPLIRKQRGAPDGTGWGTSVDPVLGGGS